MKECIESIKEIYTDGISMMSESLPQVAHVSCILSILLVLLNISKADAIVYTIAFGIYLIFLSIFGIKKFYECGEDERRYQLLFIIFNIALFWIVAIFNGFVKTLLIALICGMVTGVYMHLGEYLICYSLLGKRSKFEIFFQKRPLLYFILMLIAAFLMILIPVILLQCNIVIKVVIVIAYLLMVPIISKLADEGIDIVQMFE